MTSSVPADLRAWAAGFFDGEGSVLIVGRGGYGPYPNYLTLCASITQVHRAPLDLLATWWGGKVRVAYAGNERQRQAYEWRLHGHAAVPFLRDIEPHLQLKGPHARIGLVFATTLADPHGGSGRSRTPEQYAERLRLQSQLRALNRRGPA